MKPTFCYRLLAAAIAAVLVGCVALPQGGAGYARACARTLRKQRAATSRFPGYVNSFFIF